MKDNTLGFMFGIAILIIFNLIVITVGGII